MSAIWLRVLRSELHKLLTLRAVWVTMVVTAPICVGMAGLTAPSVGEAILARDPALAPGLEPETVGLEWINLGLIGIAIIGVIAGSNEFVGGQIHTSLLAVPQRLHLATAKVAALLLVIVLLAAITIPALSILSQLGLGELSVLRDGIPPSLVARWMGAFAQWAATALIGLALGLWLRQSLIPLLAIVVVSQLTLPLVYLLPLAQYSPFAAGTQLFDPGMMAGSSAHAALPLPIAAAALAAWTLGLVAVAVARFVRRDVRA